MANSIYLGDDGGRMPPPTMSSRGRPWGGVIVDWYWWNGPFELVDGPLERDTVAACTLGTVRLGESTHDVGAVSVHPKGMAPHWHAQGPGSIVLLRMAPALLRRELAPCPGRRDPFVSGVVAQFMDELRRPAHPVQEALTQALAQALSLHLLHRFAAAAGAPGRAQRGLSDISLGQVHGFVAAHLHEHIDLRTLAAVANVSRFHFCRLYKESTGINVMAYVERERMRRARDLIRLGRLTLSQVAAMVGYDDQSHFTRRFRVVVGETPSAFARSVA